MNWIAYALLLSLANSSRAFLFPNNVCASVSTHTSTNLEVLNGPQTGGTDASSSLPDAYGKVSVDNPWGDRGINGAYYRGPVAPDGSPMVPYSPPRNSKIPNSSINTQVMPVAKGRIITTSGGREGSSKYAVKSDGTKWSTTKWAKNPSQET